MILLELGDEPFDDTIVEVVAAQVCITVRRLDLEHALAQFEDGDIVCATSQVEDRDRLFGLLLQAVRQRCRCRFVENSQHLEPRYLARILRRLTLTVVEVGRYRDHGLRHRLPEIVLGGLLHLLEHHRRNLGR